MLIALLTAGCRDVRLLTDVQGTTPIAGPNIVAVVRAPRDLEALGIRDPELHFNHEFGVVLLMGPHRATGYHQIIESIRANDTRVRIVAFEREPLDGGEPRPPYRTYTLWIVPNSVYRHGSSVDVVSPDGVPIASTVLR